MSIKPRESEKARKRESGHAGAGRLILGLALLCLASCSHADTEPGAIGLSLGTWGGDNAGMIVSDSLVHVHVGCTYGDVTTLILLDANGSFSVPASYQLHAYPVALGPAVPAEMDGTLDGNRLSFTMLVHDTVAQRDTTLGPVTVTLGTTPQLGACPICVKPGERVPRFILRSVIPRW